MKSDLDPLPRSSYQQKSEDSFLQAGDSSWLESKYEDFLSGETSSNDWNDFFATESHQEKIKKPPELYSSYLHELYIAKSKKWFQQNRPTATPASSTNSNLVAKATQWIDAYRRYGYQNATISPLASSHPYPSNTQLSPNHWGLQASMQIPSFGVVPKETATVAEIAKQLEKTYHGSIGIEIDHVRNQEEQRWMTEHFEKPVTLTVSEQLQIFNKLLYTELLERHIHNNFVGQKRFSLEGTDSLIPLLDYLIRQGNQKGIEDILIGMAHRGRLNVLINIMGKTPAQLFNEFAGKFESVGVNGDVKYHLGFSSAFKSESSVTHLALAFNPSHLEIITPVVLGSTRARQDRLSSSDQWKILPITVHGDAAFSGQGVVMESLNMSQTRGFGTKGTIHIIVNNQIGFTIDHPEDARSTPYSSDPARFIDAPIIHVNADDPNRVIQAGAMALAYRNTFHKDIVIDLVGYRRYGHNEADDPTVTQPIKYGEIKNKPTVVSIYRQFLLEQNLFDEAKLDSITQHCKSKIESGECTVDEIEYVALNNKRFTTWKPYTGASDTLLFEQFTNHIPVKELSALGTQLATFPEAFTPHPQIKKLFASRLAMAKGDQLVDWGFAENLSYATLLKKGYGMRLTGQDVKRGTFFHRHSIIIDYKTGAEYNCLEQFVQNNKKLSIYDSLLSEEAVLAFEYGYSTAEPETLLIWEAQFGDFANGAQVVFDQFISSGEAKWARLSGLVMFLPHGYEGQGPEHSSARLERYIQLCAQNNIQVAVPTTPAQIYHLLQRQMLRTLRKPLIVLTPKSLLRHPKATNTLDELANGHFQTIIDDTTAAKKKVTKLIFCSGKIYYQLIEKRKELEANHVAIIRIEQLYPFPKKEYVSIIKSYPSCNSAIWCQEEPKNQGAWYNIRHRLTAPFEPMNITMEYTGRPISASPAVGLGSLHQKEQETLVLEAFQGHEETDEE
ncbi:MAG: 2-oxoglutarate dehydrogenase E1 component [Methylacidiphilales bacterium]|nr:2-oxoglutarate dehydrogenase E1 component [Candidatus Methylacidiphilales bacterium]